jgi:hypothetical protein
MRPLARLEYRDEPKRPNVRAVLGSGCAAAVPAFDVPACAVQAAIAADLGLNDAGLFVAVEDPHPRFDQVAQRLLPRGLPHGAFARPVLTSECFASNR